MAKIISDYEIYKTLSQKILSSSCYQAKNFPIYLLYNYNIMK